ncbi:efflux RND transporter periplasmic adaptor subunit [Cobetia amphilecti]|jgi:multidrug resistance efflux pump|uniref:Efflux RND transporter periplasmic adaptor subunit n=2 Tax=Cobetia TaxID=204286 RepID=A0ABT6ULP7_9GAMM|nr:efflux RND transporter periplasmic adaptor subunit [Cobetia amphilecti]MBR9798075.1 efflux RND transporter periplasmic adaptor subunit [Gammaproteobacteria bacterium]MDI5882779.1 efflux RND transporter periplasmic adaptor subunit [Cobetia amphilecti]
MRNLRQKAVKWIITLCLVAAAAWCAVWLWNTYMYSPWTRDARVRAEVITLSPDVSGWVRELNVADTTRVKEGDVILQVDRARYEAALAKAKASLASAKATLSLKEHESNRRGRLTNRAISEEERDSARLEAEVARADVQQAEAAVQSAQLDLERTRVVAPADGSILNMHLSQGNYVTAGTAVMALIKDDSFYLSAYFQETKLQHVRPGDPVQITLMSGNEDFKGRVVGIGQGIADDNTATNAQQLPQVSATFSWVRLAQRIPVRVEFDDIEAVRASGVNLAAGMTASVRLITTEDGNDEATQAKAAPAEAESVETAQAVQDEDGKR